MNVHKCCQYNRVCMCTAHRTIVWHMVNISIRSEWSGATTKTSKSQAAFLKDCSNKQTKKNENKKTEKAEHLHTPAIVNRRTENQHTCMEWSGGTVQYISCGVNAYNIYNVIRHKLCILELLCVGCTCVHNAHLHWCIYVMYIIKSRRQQYGNVYTEF